MNESEEFSENLTRPALKFTRKCEQASRNLHPWHGEKGPYAILNREGPDDNAHPFSLRLTFSV